MPSADSTPLFLETNVWLDYFLPDRAGHEAAFLLVDRAVRSGRKLLYSIAGAKDVYYLLAATAKAQLRNSDGPLTENQCLAIKMAAQACVDQMSIIAIGVGSSPNDVRMAMHLLGTHDDFEDNLMLAAAMRAQPCIFVTSDKALLAHSPVPASPPNQQALDCATMSD